MIIKYTTDLATSIYQDALNIRTTVFINEQQIDPAIEIDDVEKDCQHFVLYDHQQAVATCRLLPLDDNTVKLQRMAVLKDQRGQHLGTQLMTHCEEIIKKSGFQKICLGAQETAIPFYQKLGYQAYGDVFLDAGIRHFMMEKKLS